jgi:hypothetical protein
MKQITPNERALPLYQAGLKAGTDIGLTFALTAVTTERIREGEIQAAHTDRVAQQQHVPPTPTPGC